MLLDKIASGPPLYSPFKLLDPVVNIGEMFIHHEDVRRAESGWEPRELDDATVRALGRGLPIMARLTLAKVPARVSLRTPEGKTLATVGRGPDLTVTGEPPELLMFISGRDEVRLTFDGDDRWSTRCAHLAAGCSPQPCRAGSGSASKPRCLSRRRDWF